jgi:hypothetical protein
MANNRFIQKEYQMNHQQNMNTIFDFMFDKYLMDFCLALPTSNIVSNHYDLILNRFDYINTQSRNW